MDGLGGLLLAVLVRSSEGAMNLIRIDGQLHVDGTNARMRRLLARIKATEDRKTLRILNRAWWREYFRIRRNELKKAA